MTTRPLPDRLAAVVEAFRAAPRTLRLPLLLEHARRVPPLPAEYADTPGRLERVEECQTPFYLAAEVDASGRVRLHFDAPEEAPTTRGFAGILWTGLDGATVDEVLGVPGDVADHLALSDLISPLRLRGMAAIVVRLQRQLRGVAAGKGAPPP